MVARFRGRVKGDPRGDQPREHSAFYLTYMQSDAWRGVRAWIIKAAGGKCERCGVSGDQARLEVHHLTYVRLGREQRDDLQALCVDCHVLADIERARRVKGRRVYVRLSGWAYKAYGPDWLDSPGYEAATEAYEHWLEGRHE